MVNLADPLYRNWVKGSLGLKYLKQGLQCPVDRLVQKQHKKLLREVEKKTGFPAVNCTECTLDNLLPEHTRKKCIQRYKSKCFCNQQQAGRRKCPNNFCSFFYDLIILAHDERNPTWSNTDPRRWYSDHWSFAQCYVSTSGYLDKPSATETDAAGLLSVVLNNIEIRDTVDNVDNFKQARDCRNDLMHSTNFEVQGVQLERYIDTMIQVLKDATLLAQESEANAAVEELNKLKENHLIITTEDITSVLEHVIEENTRRAQSEIEKSKQVIQTCIERLKTLKDSISTVESTCISSIMQAKNNAIVNINDTASSAQNQLIAVASSQEKEMVTRAKHQLYCQTGVNERRLAKRAKQFEKEMTRKAKRFRSDIAEAASKEVINIQTSSTGSDNVQSYSTEKYEQMKTDLRSDLITFYRKRHSSLPLSPLQEEQDAPLIDFYVSPTLKAVHGKTRGTEDKSTVSYSGVFTHDSRKCMDIYLTSPAGTGKTAFTKRMAITWCQAQQPTDDFKEYFSEFQTDIDVMKTFPFLFLIMLRDVGKEHCDVDSMIRNEILTDLSGKYTDEFMIRLLRDEKVVTILDGLDEWSHTTADNAICKKISDIPHRKARENCTILTTTISWKFDVLRISSSQMDHKIEILPLDRVDSECLVKRATNYLNSKYKEEKCYEDFREISEKKPLDRLIYIPLILMQLLCLWYDGEPIGQSLCQIFTNILEFLFKRAVKKSPRIGSSSTHRRTVHLQLPKCFEQTVLCKEHEQLLLSLGKLAFKRLFCADRSSMLAFDYIDAENILSKQDLNVALETGILTGNKVQTLTSRRYVLSFIHKTYQEFLAALYISACDVFPTEIFTFCESVTRLLDISYMFVFLSGLNGSKMNEMCPAITDVISDDIEKYRRTYKIKSPIKQIQRIFIDCFDENNKCGGQGLQLPLADILVDDWCDDFDKLNAHLLRDELRNIKSLHLACFPENDISALLKKLQTLYNLQKLSVHYADPREVDSMIKGSSETLSVLNIHHVERLSDKTLNTLTHIENLHALSLKGIKLTCIQISKLYACISRCTFMKELRLEKLSCPDDFDVLPCLNLTDLTKLEILRIVNLPASIEISQRNVSCLKEVKCDISVDFRFLLGSKQLQMLHITGCTDYGKADNLDHLTKVLLQLPSLKNLKIKHCSLKKLHFERCSKHLELIELKFVKMSSASFKKTVLSLTHLPQAIQVRLIAAHTCMSKATEEYFRKSKLFLVYGIIPVVILKKSIT
ncbi:uncharacterized protein LOC128549070 [Mercenaria mercenaria]|uniref:uncharacterized protein LOC128549070 n=1 Tax=Mercenaria mercenaria TaxID=6596 RepID=UPI00234FB06A|nr:uncharacterized protein LOC128549070 [Mercenaria mercenaria]